MRAPGFSLVECLIGLALSLLVICACLQFFITAEGAYFKLKDKEEAAQSVLAATDKMRVDILRSGQGLVPEAALGLVEAAAESGGGLLLTRAEGSYSLTADVAAGDSRILLASVTELKPGREVLVSDGENGEVRTIADVAAGAVNVSPPLGKAYTKGGATLLLLERISLTLDARQGVIRRRVNSSSAQPLLENAGTAQFAVDSVMNLVRVRFSLASQGGADYELCLFPKNPALAGKR
jgi:hypothetical protein